MTIVLECVRLRLEVFGAETISEGPGAQTAITVVAPDLRTVGMELTEIVVLEGQTQTTKQIFLSPEEIRWMCLMFR